MARSAFSTLTFAILLAALELGSCLRCFQCNTQSSPDCADPFPAKKYLVDCSTQDSVNFNRQYLFGLFPDITTDGVAGATRYCHKIVLQSGTTVRTCLDANPADLNHTCRLLDTAAKNAPGFPNKQLKHCSVCDKDACNAAGSISASLPLAALMGLASFLYYKH